MCITNAVVATVPKQTVLIFDVLFYNGWDKHLGKLDKWHT